MSGMMTSSSAHRTGSLHAHPLSGKEYKRGMEMLRSSEILVGQLDVMQIPICTSTLFCSSRL